MKSKLLVICTLLMLPTTTLSADIILSYTATDALGTSPSPVTGSGTGFLAAAPFTVGNFTLTISTTTQDPSGTGVGGNGTVFNPSHSILATTTIAISNLSSTTDTLDLLLTGKNFTVGSHDTASFSISGTGSPFSTIRDNANGSSYIDTTNAGLLSTPIPPGAGGITGIPTATNLATASYLFGNLGNSGSLLFTNSGLFSMSQDLGITLGGGDSSQITITTTAVPTPEPSTLVIFTMGAVGMIVYGWRQKRRY